MTNMRSQAATVCSRCATATVVRPPLKTPPRLKMDSSACASGSRSCSPKAYRIDNTGFYSTTAGSRSAGNVLVAWSRPYLSCQQCRRHMLDAPAAGPKLHQPGARRAWSSLLNAEPGPAASFVLSLLNMMLSSCLHKNNKTKEASDTGEGLQFLKQRQWPPLFFPLSKRCGTVAFLKNHKTKEASDTGEGLHFSKRHHWPPLFFLFLRGCSTVFILK